MNIRNPPSSTYRLQISSTFTLNDAAALCDYLSVLGAGWVYLSPILRAEPGSTHGYDVVDHSMIDPERGGEVAFTRVSASAHAAGLGVLVDIVPNHMGVATPNQNAWWWDLLARGSQSRFAQAFDVDWDAAGGRIRIPVLGDGDAELEQLRIDDGDLCYFDHRFPIAEGTAEPGDAPQQVHDRQNYELVNWRRADADLNYRRFFAVNSLAGIRVEDRRVFEESHIEIRRWFEEGMADGIRVDHPDGLAQPGRYLDELSELAGGAPIWVEKILEPGEQLPENWATAGTTGYDALGDFDRVLVDAEGQPGLERAQQEWGATAPDVDWQKLIFGTKTGIADGILRSEVNRLARLMPAIDGAAHALIPIIAAFEVYRSYLPLGLGHLEAARILARNELPELAERIDEVARVLATEGDPASIRFQQTSGMVMAKGVEDTAFYRFGSLTSLNEVGADPSEFAIDVHSYHDRQARRQSALPNSMTTLSTHDTKRSEDVRARINALSERPELWSSFAARVHGVADLGDPVLENLLWQAIVGAWPASRERLHGYAEKAARESGMSTNWIDPDTEFESRMHGAVDSAFDNPEVAAAIDEVVAAIEPASYSNSLSAKLLQLASPGVPDVYQGSELWDRSLVDPDNRRPVDFRERRKLLERIDGGWLPPVDDSGAAKLLLVSRALRLRRDHPEWFTRYRGLTVFGTSANHAIAFDRGGVIAVATRLSHGLEQSGGWQDTTIEPGGRELVDVLTGRVFGAGSVRLADLLERYPVALLTENRGVRE